MKRADLFATVSLVLLVSGFLLGAGIYWDVRVRLNSEADLHVRREPPKEPDPVVPVVSSMPEPPVVKTPPGPPAPQPMPADDFEPVVDGMWLCVESGKRYVVSSVGDGMKMYEDDLTGRKLLVGAGKQHGRKLNFDFHSTLHDVDGSLSLEVVEDGRKMQGMFRGLAPKDKGPVTLLRVE